MNLINAHTHIDFLDFTVNSVLNATNPTDWQKISDISQTNNKLLPAFGLHPYFASNDYLCNTHWLEQLQLYLDKPNASLGEVGLDKNADTDIQTQIKILEMQLDIASEKNKVASIHCFGAFDKLIPILKKRKLIYILHGYAGSPEITKSLLDIGDCFFSFGYIQQNRMSKIEQILKIIPTENILIETDSKQNLTIQDVFTTITKMKNSITEESLRTSFNKIFI